MDFEKLQKFNKEQEEEMYKKEGDIETPPYITALLAKQADGEELRPEEKQALSNYQEGLEMDKKLRG